MCTVTYIPTKSGFQLTSNRDENVNRKQAIAPRKYQNGNYTLLYPKDADRNGSWIATKNNGDTVVLLNGAFVKHTAVPPYKTSRGLVLMDIINAQNPFLFYQDIDLIAVEPFTLVLYAQGSLYECRWDGERKHIKLLDGKDAHIWSSATLYDEVAAAKRVNWFNNWCKSANPDQVEDIMYFHHHAGEGDDTDALVINRSGKMKTVSVTNINVSLQNITMTYHDLRDGNEYVHDLAIEADSNRPVVLPRFFGLRRFLIRLFNWEYWSLNMFYAPVMFYWFWLSFKARSFFFFSTANPLIENGGFTLESKASIYNLIPQQYYPKTILFKTKTDFRQIKSVIKDKNFDFPLIAKPDIGGRGVQVKLVHNEVELLEYTQQIRVDFLVQEYIKYKSEVGIFYYRLPGEAKGQVTGIVGKEFLALTGDGKHTMMELIIKEPRYLLQLPVLIDTYGDELKQVLPIGKSKTLVPYGNHARGAKFIDLSHLITDELTDAIDDICRQIPGFYFGRLDVMYNTWDELCRGKNLSIIELNGAGSEPTHIYDPKHSIFFAWYEIIRHWKLLYRVSKLNKQQKSINYMTHKQGITMLKNNTEYLKLVS
ncbi:NRDE family protein [Mucilaginibacter sp. P25]|uniref:RimK-like ATP-grasp domain-containing protein n=1 Tax=Mucilaginibacter gossypii TaxID=551996 RepID=A0A1G8F947_9SPHI|nr:NRDE family protein [Mucilaginibacter gossypii]SDH78674.1 RimK-like ATP-grasp domain-containing protein [Mucilaginibacter gossypii]